MGREAKATKSASSDFPYESYRGTAVWKIVDKAINDLAENHDLVETARRDYIVGFICKKLEHLLPKVVSD